MRGTARDQRISSTVLTERGIAVQFGPPLDDQTFEQLDLGGFCQRCLGVQLSRTPPACDASKFPSPSLPFTKERLLAATLTDKTMLCTKPIV